VLADAKEIGQGMLYNKTHCSVLNPLEYLSQEDTYPDQLVVRHIHSENMHLEMSEGEVWKTLMVR
jgi:hypothetical protein